MVGSEKSATGSTVRGIPRSRKSNSTGRIIQKRNSFVSGILSLDSEIRNIPLSYKAPTPEDEDKSGVLEKLKSCDLDLDDLWDSKRVVLTNKLLCFTPIDSHQTVSECIPIHEISQVPVA